MAQEMIVSGFSRLKTYVRASFLPHLDLIITQTPKRQRQISVSLSAGMYSKQAANSMLCAQN
jgi:hypothetical protein